MTLAADDLKMLIMTAIPDTPDALKLHVLQVPDAQHRAGGPSAGTSEDLNA